MGVTSLLELIEHLLTDSDAASDFKSHPHQFLADHGLGDLSGHDVFDALKLGFDSVHPDLAHRIVLPEDPTAHHSAADAFGHLLGTADTAASPFDDNHMHHVDIGVGHDLGHDGGHDLGHHFGLGHDFGSHDTGFGAGHDSGDHGHLAHLALDLGAHVAFDLPGDDTDSNTFNQGFGNGAHHVQVEHLADVDDLHTVDSHHDDHHDHDFGHGPH